MRVLRDVLVGFGRVVELGGVETERPGAQVAVVAGARTGRSNEGYFTENREAQETYLFSLLLFLSVNVGGFVSSKCTSSQLYHD